MSIYLYRTIPKALFNLAPQREKQLAKKLKQLAVNPMHPSLRSKRIQGTEKYFESSVNMDIRIIWFYEGEELIILVDVGHHGILNRY